MSILSKRTRWQVLATLAGCIMSLGHGITIGWFSPMFYLFLSDKNPLGDPLSLAEATWAGSIFGLGALVSNLILGWTLNFFGCKLCMYAMAVTNLVSWIFVYFGRHVACLFAARFLAGFSGGTLVVILPIFTAEISDNDVRGTLTSMIILFMCVGITLGLTMSTYISYFVLPFIIGFLPLIYMLVIIPLPETPDFHLKHGRDVKAEKSFYFYKNLGGKSSSDPAKEDEAKEEYNAYRENILANNLTQKATRQDYCSKEAWKAIGLIAVLLLANAFSGALAILTYCMQIFGELGNAMNPNTSTILVGFFQLLGVACAVIVVDRMGRRWLLLLSLVYTGLGELAVGLLKHLAPTHFLNENDWVGLVLIGFVEFMVSAGLLPLTFVIVVELLPVKILAIGNSISMAALSLLLFVVLMIYPLLIDLGVSWAMYMSASACFIGAILLGIFMPETKGRRLSR